MRGWTKIEGRSIYEYFLKSIILKVRVEDELREKKKWAEFF